MKLKNLFEYLISAAFGVLLIVLVLGWLGVNLVQRIETTFAGVTK